MNLHTIPQFGISKKKTKALLDTLDLTKKPLTLFKGGYNEAASLNYQGYNELARLETAIKQSGATHYKFIPNGGKDFHGDPIVRLYVKA